MMEFCEQPMIFSRINLSQLVFTHRVYTWISSIVSWLIWAKPFLEALVYVSISCHTLFRLIGNLRRGILSSCIDSGLLCYNVSVKCWSENTLDGIFKTWSSFFWVIYGILFCLSWTNLIINGFIYKHQVLFLALYASICILMIFFFKFNVNVLSKNRKEKTYV